MYQSWKSRAAAIAIAAAMLVPALMFATGAGAAKGGTDRPLNVSVEGTFVSNFPNLTYTGTGNASHLGKTSYVSSSGLFTFTETLTAANGDTLTLVDNITIVSSTQATGVWTVTGGTGRFAGATGSGTSLTTHTGGVAFTQTWTGSISY